MDNERHAIESKIQPERGTPVDSLVSAAPPDGEVVAIRYRDNWDGEGDIGTFLAYVREGIWYADDSGNKLLQYEGDEIFEWWPLTPGTGQKL